MSLLGGMMNRNAMGCVAVLAGIVAAGCGGGSAKYPDASVNFDAAGRSDAGVDTGTLPPPSSGPGSQLLVPGIAFLVGSGANSCTSQVPASGDRWCAFARPSTAPS